MRTLQEIFAAVIAAGHYLETYTPSVSSPFMCNALSSAVYNGTITGAEERKALRSIEQYIVGVLGAAYSSQSLVCALINVRYTTTFKDRLAIYQNWGKRPRIRSKV